jgi:peptide/nickel transport system substrate-binding protein
MTIIFLLSSLYAFTDYLRVDRIVYTGQIKEAAVGAPKVTNPYQSLNQTEKNLSQLLFSSLIRNLRIENGEIKYDFGLAQKIETNSSFSEIKITLVDNAEFSNGTNITSADIIHSLQLSPNEKNFQEEIVDEKTVLLKFKNQTSQEIYKNLNVLTQPIVSRDENFSETYSTNLITSGFYRIRKIKKDNEGNIMSVELARFQNGEQKLPYIKKYFFYIYPDESSALSDLQSKEVNLLSGVSGQIVSKIKDDKTLKVIESKLSNNFAIFLNQNRNQHLRDSEFRQILSEAIDRDQLVNQTLGGYAVPMKNILGENSKNQNLETLQNKIISNKDNGLFFENGVLYGGQKTASSTKEREVVKISITTINNKELVDTANFVANSWKKLGVETEIRTIDRSQLQQVVKERDFDTLLFGFSTKDYSDYYSFFHSEERTFPRLNIANYASKKADAILNNLKSEKDFKKKAELLSDLSKELSEDTPIILLYKPLKLLIKLFLPHISCL